jgi:hypothetical protein
MKNKQKEWHHATKHLKKKKKKKVFMHLRRMRGKYLCVDGDFFKSGLLAV